MNFAQVISAIAFPLSLILFIILVTYVFPSYRLDSFRQNMFALRDELWDYAADGHISFEDPAYKLLRQLMNGFIRYAHQLTFYRLCLSLLIWRLADSGRPSHWTEEWTSAIAQIRDEDVRARLGQFYGKSISIVLKRVIYGSPLLFLCGAIAALGFAAHGHWKNAKQAVKDNVGLRLNISRIQDEAAAY
jgi:hypothetical protein